MRFFIRKTPDHVLGFAESHLNCLQWTIKHSFQTRAPGWGPGGLRWAGTEPCAGLQSSRCELCNSCFCRGSDRAFLGGLRSRGLCSPLKAQRRTFMKSENP